MCLEDFTGASAASAGKVFKGDISVEGCPDISDNQVQGWGGGAPRGARARRRRRLVILLIF